MNEDLYERLAKYWKNKNSLELLQESENLNSRNKTTEALILQAFSKSIAGKTSEANALYQNMNVSSQDFLFQSMFEIDSQYCETKLQRRPSRILIKGRLVLIVKLIFKVKHSLARQLIHHAFYTWYITAFWYNHLESLVPAMGLFIYGYVLNQPEARVHGKFLIGHLANVKGYAKLGVSFVTSAFEERTAIGPWLDSAFLSYMAYGLYMVGQGEEIIPEILFEAEVSLKMYPDPFYRILLYVSILRYSSQMGDIETSENVASKLIAFAEATGAHRFYFSSKADLALCYGMRGLYWKCDQILNDIKEYDDKNADAVEAGSFYRLRGWAYFFVGKYKEALADAERALWYFSISKSFFMALAMSKILKENASFRIDLNTSNSVAISLTDTRRHAKKLLLFRRKFGNNRVLVKMIAEEENSLFESFGRFWQPGYSRDTNVISSQNKLLSIFKDIALAENDADAWTAIMNQISDPFSIRLTSLVPLDRKPDFQTRSTYDKAPGVEICIDRSHLGNDRYDSVRFELSNKSNLVSVLDAMYTLLPTLNCLFRIRDQQSIILLAEREKTFNLIASQVAHDIRSPLSALNMISSVLTEVSEEKRQIIRDATKRINDIANQLLIKAKQSLPSVNDNSENEIKAELLSAVVDILVTEKRIQFRDILSVRIESELNESYGLFANINSIELKRALSNLINNSIEAFENEMGWVRIGIEPYKDKIRIYVKDNGRGISSHILERLGQLGLSSGKKLGDSGNGLGVYHAKKTIESFGGKFIAESIEGEGTEISLIFEKSPTPLWFVDQITLGNRQQIVCVDDDVSIHQIWSKKFEYAKLNRLDINMFSLSSGNNLASWLKNNESLKLHSIFLMDYEFLGQTETGIDLIEKYDIADQTILVTNRFEDPCVRKRCADLGVKLIPKAMANLIPIEF